MVRVHLTRCLAFFFLRFCPAAGVRVCVRAPVTRAAKKWRPCAYSPVIYQGKIWHGV